MEQMFDTVDKLSEAIRHMQKCLECTICLHTVTEPVKTRCGHWFCRACIGKVLAEKKASCPLCNTVLKRRSITNDHHMEMCVDRLQKLIEAIGADTGIEILSHSTKPHDTKESCSSNARHYNTTNAEQNIQNRPGSPHSNAKLQIKDQSSLRSNRRTLKDAKLPGGVNESTNERNKRNCPNDERNKSSKDVLKYGLSGVHSLDSSVSDVTTVKNVVDNKVESWLKTLPDAVEDICVPIQQNDPSSNDIITDTTSTNIDALKFNTHCKSMSEFERLGQSDKNGRQTRDAIRRHSSEQPLHYGNNKGGKNKGTKANRSLATKTSGSTGTDLKFNVVHARVRAKNVENQQKSNVCNEVNVQDNHEPQDTRSVSASEKTYNQTHSNDTHRISAPDMLPSTEKNWCSVVKFGKEMRTKKKKKKKLKSLNVSIENSSKSSRQNETTEGGIFKSGPIKDVRQETTDNRKENDSNMSESIANTRTVNNGGLNENEKLPNIESTHANTQNVAMNSKEETCPANTSNVSMSEVIQPVMNSSFITLKEGEQVRITNLKNYQMNDIIGVGGSNTCQSFTRKSTSPEFHKNESLSKKPGEPLQTLADDEIEVPLHATPVKGVVKIIDTMDMSGQLPSSNKVSLGLSKERKISSPGAQKNQRLSSSSSTSELRSPLSSGTPSRGKLSLKKNQHSSASKSIMYSWLNYSPQAASAKRDLSKEICQDKAKPNVRLSSEMQGQGKNLEKNSSEFSSTVKSNATRDAKESGNFVTFKKLGRIIKPRKNIVKYIYLGSTRRSRLRNISRYTFILNLHKPCNPIDSEVVENLENLRVAESNAANILQVTGDEIIPTYNNINCKSSLDTSNVTREKSILQLENTNQAKETIDTPIVRSSPFKEKTPTKRIDVYKTNVPEKRLSTDNSTTSKSTDVLVVSLCESNEQNEQNESLRTKDPVEKDDRVEGQNVYLQNCNTSKKVVIVNGIKMLSPEKDSQLKFLSTDSPLSENLETSKLMQRLDALKKNGIPRKSNFSDVKIVHPEARIIRRSREATSKGTEHDARISSKKRKRSDLRERLPHRKRRGPNTNDEESTDDNESDSDRSFSSRTTQIRTNNAIANETAKFSKQSNNVGSSELSTNKITHSAQSADDQHVEDVDAVVFSSDTDIIDDLQEDAFEKPKETRDRVTAAPNSNTDSIDTMWLIEKKKDVFSKNFISSTSAQISKRKRAMSVDSDDDVDPNTIINNWCDNLNSPQRNTKKGKAAESKTNDAASKLNKSNVPTRSFVTSSLDKDLFESEQIFDQESMPYTTLTSKATSGSSKDDFNSIIDRVREIQRTDDNTSSANNNKVLNGNEKDIKDSCLMQDNFDEIIANVDTEQFTNGFPETEEIVSKDSKLSSKYVPSIERPTEKRMKQSCVPKVISSVTITNPVSFVNNHTSVTSYNSNNSDKINNKRPSKSVEPYEINDNHEDTLTSDYVTEKKSTWTTVSNRNKLLEMAKSHELSDDNKQLIKCDNSLKKPSMHTSSTQDSPDLIQLASGEIPIGIINSAFNDVPCEQDSLMNVTQHQLLLKQFEEDLFGIPSSRKTSKASNSSERLSRDEQQTPRKRKGRDINRSCSRTKDVEYSGGEDDIVENTPDTKTKNSVCNVQTMNSTVRRNLTTSQTTPMSKSGEKPSITTPSPLSDRSSNSTSRTPTSTRIVYPLYQSTPRVHGIDTKSDHDGTPACIGNRKIGRASNTSISLSRQARDDTVGNTYPISDGRKLWFVCSGLVPAKIERVKEFAAMLNAKYTTQFCRDVTHVIVKTNEENNTANKTLKYLQGIAHRKWIVGYKWVVDSLKEKKLLNEEPYEVLDSTTLEAGPRHSRLRQRGLFEDFVFLCFGTYVDISVEQYKDLLLSTGATIVETMEELAAERTKLKAIIIQADIHDNKIINWYQKTRAVPIAHEWVVECISQYKLVSMYSHLQELLPQDVLALGYPEFLVEDEAEGEGDSTCEMSS